MVFVACGGSDEPAPVASTSVATTTAPGSSPVATDGIEDQTFTVGEHFWHTGFRVDIADGAISSTEDQLSGKITRTLSLDATLENTGADTGYFGASLGLATSSNSYPASLSSELPDVPGGLKAQATFEFRVDDNFDLASAELIVGDASENRARIPLSGSTAAVRLEPTELAISGMLSLELIDMAFTSASLRYDVPDRHREVEMGKQALTMSFHAISRKPGNWQVFATNLALILPDGTAIGADDVEIGSLPGSNEGTTTPDRWVRFLVEERPAGDFSVRLAPGSWFIGDDDVTEATFEFTIGQ